MPKPTDVAIVPAKWPSPDKSTVDHPAHYGGADDLYEAIKVIRAWRLGFNLGNTVKYIRRGGLKASAPLIEDLKKARWYLDDEIKFLEAELNRKAMKHIEENDGAE